MKNLFRRKAGPNGNFVVMNSSFQDEEEMPPPAQGEDGATDVSSPEDEDRTSVASNRSKGDTLAADAAPILPMNKSWEASKSFQEDDDDEGSMVEVVTSEKGNSVILGDDEEIFLAEKLDAPKSSRFGKFFRRSSTAATAPTASRRGSFFGRKSSLNSTSPTERAGWTPREKVLLWITAFNTILIIILLGSNAALVSNQKETKRSFSAATDGGCPVTGDGSTIDATPPSEWKPQNTTNTTNGGTVTAPVPSPVFIPTPVVTQNTTVSVGDPNSSCGCAACTDSVWNTLAGEFTCGDRITYLTTSMSQQYPTQVQACRQVAFEFPCLCGGCDPSRCSLPTPEFNVPSSWVPPTVDKFGNAATPAPTPVTAVTDSSISAENMPLYCFPDASGRTTYTLWGGMVVQPKASEGVCGPGNNFFRSDTVQVDTSADTLTLFYANSVASEVRVLLPAAQRPYTYGSYRFSIKSVEVLNSAGAVLSNTLPKELVLGLFTWDPLESYAVHENYNHEVDIELSRWNCAENSDLQFLVQPPGLPQMHRLFSGDPDATELESKYKQGGQVYKFDWNPGRIDWVSTAGELNVNNAFSLKTAEAVFRDVDDYVQCLPDRGGNMEVRINLWNMLGALTPAGLASTDIVKVVIDSFSFTPSGQTHVGVGGICTKHCQCESGVAQCISNVCTAVA